MYVCILGMSTQASVTLTPLISRIAQQQWTRFIKQQRQRQDLEMQAQEEGLGLAPGQGPGPGQDAVTTIPAAHASCYPLCQCGPDCTCGPGNTTRPLITTLLHLPLTLETIHQKHRHLHTPDCLFLIILFLISVYLYPCIYHLII